MCLIIDKKIHKLFKSRVTLTPIIVYKVLQKTKDGYRTPYQCKEINFIDGQCVLKSKLVKDDKYTVGKGIHAYTNIIAAYQPFRSLTAQFIIVKAIIPKFSNYFIGERYEIASNKMIITDEIIRSI